MELRADWRHCVVSLAYGNVRIASLVVQTTMLTASPGTDAGSVSLPLPGAHA